MKKLRYPVSKMKRNVNQSAVTFDFMLNLKRRKGLRPTATYHHPKRCLTVSIPAFQIFFHPIWKSFTRLTGRQWKYVKLVLWATLIVWNIGGFAVGYYIGPYLVTHIPDLMHSAPATAAVLWGIFILVILGYTSLYAGSFALIVSLLNGRIVKEKVAFYKNQMTIAVMVAGVKIKQRTFSIADINMFRLVKNPLNTQGFFQFEYHGNIVDFGYGSYVEEAPGMAAHFRDIMAYGCHRTECLQFGHRPAPAMANTPALCNADLTALRFPLLALNRIIIDADTCDTALVACFLHHIKKLYDIYNCNKTVELHLYGNADIMPAEISNELESSFICIRKKYCYCSDLC